MGVAICFNAEPDAEQFYENDRFINEAEMAASAELQVGLIFGSIGILITPEQDKKGFLLFFGQFHDFHFISIL